MNEIKNIPDKTTDKKEVSKLFNAISMPFKGAKFLLDKTISAAWVFIWPLPDNFESKKSFFFGFKRTALAAAFVMVAQPLTGTFFKTGQEYLEERGVDGNIALELSGGVVPHVRERNFIGMAHSILDVPFLPNTLDHYNKVLHHYNAYATINSIGLNSCNTLEIGDMGLNLEKHEVSAYTRLNGTDINNIQISAEELELYVMFHEFAHCHPDNLKLGTPFSEADADYRAIKALESIKPDSRIADFVMAFRATSFNGENAWLVDGKSHDVALYLEARLNNRPIPSIEDIKKANDAAERLINSDILVINKMAHQKLEPLARKRVELYIEGMKYLNNKYYPKSLSYKHPRLGS